MKVYVDELPKSCSKCEWFTPNHCSKGGRNFCLLARMPFSNTEEDRQISRGQHKDSLSDFDCPLKSLSDYTKQVRKEVCEEIRNEIDNYADIVLSKYKKESVEYSHYNGIFNVILEIVDQI